MLAAFLVETNKAAPTKFMVYMLTCACVDYFHKVLEKLIPASLKAGQPPSYRESARGH